jgi:MtrB/PioB family decaheme-associated outer membrane protein
MMRSPFSLSAPHPIRRHRLRIAIGIAMLCSGAGLADPLSGEVELGGLLLSNERFGAQGAYGPALDEGVHPLGRLDLTARGERGRARVLGSMSSRDFGALTAALISKDNDEIRLDYARVARRGDTGLSLLRGGPELMSLPPGFTPGTTTQELDLSDLEPMKLGSRRERYGISTRIFAGSDWRTEFSFRNERRRGIAETGAMVGVDPVSARTVILPEPIDDELRELDAAVSWDRDGRQLRAAYRGSFFTNSQRALGWEVPFVATGPEPFPETGRLGTPPDNEHHSISIDAGTRLGKSSRLSASASLARMQQNEALLPYSTGVSSAALPRASAEARTDVLRLALNASARPLTRLNLSASHRYYRRDDRTPAAIFEPVRGDTIVTPDRIRRPYDLYQATSILRATLRTNPGARLQTELRNDIVGRDLPGNPGHTRENSIKLSLYQPIAEQASASLSLLHGKRKRHGHGAVAPNSAPDGPCPDIVLVDPDPDGGEPREVDLCIAYHPDLRRFMLSNRERERLQATFDWWPVDSLEIELGWSLARDRYRDEPTFDDTMLGLTDGRERIWNGAIYWTPYASWTFNLSYAREYLDFAQNGRDMAFNDGAAIIDSRGNWTARSRDRVETVSAGLRLDLPDGRTRLTLDLGQVRERNRIELHSLQPTTALPEDGAKRRYAELRGEYGLNDQVKLKAGVRHEVVTARDRADSVIDLPNLPGLNGVLALRSDDTDYDALLIWSSITYLW